jgi:hypothetical protein
MDIETTIELGARVAFTGDPRITGTVVGHGYVDNSHDALANQNETHDVVIVRVDEPARLDASAVSLSFHIPFVPSVLTVLT